MIDTWGGGGVHQTRFVKKKHTSYIMCIEEHV